MMYILLYLYILSIHQDIYNILFLVSSNYHCILYNLTQKLDLDAFSKIWGHGFIKINAIDCVDNVGAYICKYMQKTDDKRLLGRKMYFNSRGLNKPTEIKNKKIVEALQSSLQSQNLRYNQRFENDYNSINYSQYNIK